MRDDLVRMEKRGFDDIYAYVMTQIPLRREEAMRKKGQGFPLNAVNEQEPIVPPTAGELDSLIRTGGSWKRPAPDAPRTGGLAGAFSGDCHYCKVGGHRAADCDKKKADISRGV